MLAITTLVSWALTASLGGYMLTRWIRRGGLARQRAARDRLGPLIIGGHASLALSGLAVWAGYVAARWVPLAWTAVGLLTLAVGFGLSTVTLWTPYPARGAAGIRGPDTASAGAAGAGAAGEGMADRGTTGKGAAGRGATGGGATGRVTDAMLTQALTDEVLLRRLVDDVLAQVPATPGRKGALRAASRPCLRARRPPAALIPVAHGIGALVTVLLAVTAAAGAS